MRMKRTKYSEIVDLIDIDAFEAAIGFEPIEQKNGEDIGHCPDVWGMHKHGDLTGKFAIHREKRLYHCFVCGGGNLCSLAMEINEMEAEEDAISWLMQFTHGDLRSDAEVADELMALLEERKETMAEKMPYFNEHVLGRFNGHTDWFKQRGISDEVVEAHKLGYSEMAMKAAPIRAGEKIDADYYGPCVVFPHFWEGTLVGWQHRWMDHPNTPKWLPKYTNTTDFPKSNTLFNYDNALRTTEPLVVVESVPTVLFLESAGVPSVAFFGGGIKEGQLRLLRRFQGGVILSPDNDEPGEKFVRTATEYLERYTEVKVLPPVKDSPGADLGDLAGRINPVDALFYHLQLAHTIDILE